MTAPQTFGVSFTAQVWDGETRLTNIDGLSFDAARHIASCAPMTGHTGRVMSDAEDYVIVYAKDGTVRVGTFGQTTIVHTQAQE